MQGADLPPSFAETEFRVESRRIDPLGTRGRSVAFGTLATASAIVALAWSAAGAWVVLPFAIVEITLVAVAFVVAERRAGDWERLVVAGDRVIVERSRGGRLTRREFNRWRTRIETARRSLVLCSAGERVAFGGLLEPRERAATGRDLRRLTRL